MACLSVSVRLFVKRSKSFFGHQDEDKLGEKRQDEVDLDDLDEDFERMQERKK